MPVKIPLEGQFPKADLTSPLQRQLLVDVDFLWAEWKAAAKVDNKVVVMGIT